MTTKRTLLKNITLHLWFEQRSKCHYCNQSTVFVPRWTQGERPALDTATLDHIVAKTRGGKDCITNFAMSCLGCNILKANITYNNFINVLTRMKALGVPLTYDYIKANIKHRKKYIKS